MIFKIYRIAPHQRRRLHLGPPLQDGEGGRRQERHPARLQELDARTGREGRIRAERAASRGQVGTVRGVIRFFKNRIYPVFRAKLFRKSDLMLKKCRFALQKHKNHPFLAIFAIFGNSVLSQPTIRHTPSYSVAVTE